MIKEIAGVIVNAEQCLDLLAQGLVARTGLAEVRAALIGGQFQGGGKDRNFRVGWFVHGNSLIYYSIREIETKRAKNSTDSDGILSEYCWHPHPAHKAVLARITGRRLFLHAVKAKTRD
ncbi:MAG: hypothetical protein ACLQVW_15275 [Limisphaerales bacterium]